MPQTVIEQPTDSPKIDHRKFNRFAPGSAARAVAARAAKRQQAAATPLPTQAIDETYKSGIQEWIKIAAHFRKDIRDAQRTRDKKALTALMMAAGIAWDKAFPKRAEDQSPLVTPQIVVEQMAKLISPSRAPVGSNPTTPDTPIDTPGCDPVSLSES